MRGEVRYLTMTRSIRDVDFKQPYQVVSPVPEVESISLGPEVRTGPDTCQMLPSLTQQGCCAEQAHATISAPHRTPHTIYHQPHASSRRGALAEERTGLGMLPGLARWQDDFFVLASDGLFHVLTTGDVIDIVVEHFEHHKRLACAVC